MRAMLELGGVQDVVGKSLGSRNPINIVHATMEALGQLRDPETERAKRLGLTRPGANGATEAPPAPAPIPASPAPPEPVAVATPSEAAQTAASVPAAEVAAEPAAAVADSPPTEAADAPAPEAEPAAETPSAESAGEQS
jgi:hypothetical protein